MAYTFSFDASLKLTTASNLAGFLNHFAREENEIEINHSNENIDHSRTSENKTYVYDPERECMVLSSSHEQIADAMRASLERAIDFETETYKTTGKSVRKDAILAYGLIMQIDPQFYKDNKDNPQAMSQSYIDMIHMAQKRFGNENIVAVSLHLDEVNPHLHFIMTPVTDDGRLSSKEFINAPKLKQMHGEFRKGLREQGYDIDLERRTPVGAKRLSEKDYKELQRAKETLEKLEEEKSTLEAQKREFEANKASQMQNIQQLQHQAELNVRNTESNLQHSRRMFRKAHDSMVKADDAWNAIVDARKLPPPPMERAGRMAEFMGRYKMGDGRTLYQHFQDAEPKMIETERENERLMAEISRRYCNIRQSFDKDYDDISL